MLLQQRLSHTKHSLLLISFLVVFFLELTFQLLRHGLHLYFEATAPSVCRAWTGSEACTLTPGPTLPTISGLIPQQRIANLFDHLFIHLVLRREELSQQLDTILVSEALMLLNEVAQLLLLEVVQEAFGDVHPVRLLLLLSMLIDRLLEPHQIIDNLARVSVHLVNLAMIAVHKDVSHAGNDTE